MHAGFGVFNDIIPAQVADLAATNAPYSPTFVGGIGGQVGGVGIAPERSRQRSRCNGRCQPKLSICFSAGGAPCAGIAAGAPTCPLAVSMNTFPSGTLKTPYYYQYNLGIERKVGTRGAARVDYVGTRGVHEPYQVELNGYQTVCDGCFAPYPYEQPLDQRFGSVNEFQTNASSNYSGLQASCHRSDRAILLCAETTPSAIAWMRFRTADCSRFPAGYSIAAAGRTQPPIWRLRLRRAP